MRVGKRFDLKIDRLALGGDGVARLPTGQAGAGDCVVFVPYACPGDAVQVEIAELHRRYARARLVRVLAPSTQRVTPPCPYHFKISSEFRVPGFELKQPRSALPNSQLATRDSKLYCGGCSWQQIDYPAQLEAKRQLVQETLERIGGLRGVAVRPTLGMSDPWRYRNKVQQPVGVINGRMVSGFYAPDSHDIVPIEDCLVQSGLSVRILNRARALLERYRVLVRHLWLRTSRDNMALLVFVTRTADFPHERAILEALAREFPELAGIHQNINPDKTNVILGRRWRKLCGSDFLEESVGSLRFRLSPGSFFQVNTLQTEHLYDTVKRLAGQGERLLDLYCGVGGIALHLAGSFKEVIGVDEVRSAITDAKRNAALNGIRNTTFIAETAERFIQNYSSPLAGEEGGGGVRRFGGTPHPAPSPTRGEGKKGLTVLLDPPRAGCMPTVLKGVAHLEPSRIVYVSCDPGTLARDITSLIKGGYKAREIQPVDLFPHTPHIETVVLLTR